ncbi:tonB-system energizer ExbB [Vibrio sp. T187]|nr:tonB-system energizer ExbB [Vibrio sp. T187]MBW3695044.1 tonB-system energizer ExbB [Vibrio sp. T187]
MNLPVKTLVVGCLLFNGLPAYAQNETEATSANLASETSDPLTTESPASNVEAPLAAESLPAPQSLAKPTEIIGYSDDLPIQDKQFQHGMTPLGMYQAADWVVKSVMILLLLASVLTWALFVTKQIQVSIACRRAALLLKELVASESLEEGKQRSFDKQGGGLALIEATQHELTLSALGRASNDGIKERVQIRLERVQASLNHSMTTGTSMLATVGSVGPFIGLFGTVWGIMNAFIGIAKTKSTTLVVVAPGIAEALLATAIGLVAAIPAVVMYNHFARSIGRYRASLADITAALLVLVSRDLDRTSPEVGSDNTVTLRKTG